MIIHASGIVRFGETIQGIVHVVDGRFRIPGQGRRQIGGYGGRFARRRWGGGVGCGNVDGRTRVTRCPCGRGCDGHYKHKGMRLISGTPANSP